MSHSPISNISLLISKHLMFVLKLTGKRSLHTPNSFEKLLQTLQGNNTTFPCFSHVGQTAKSKSRAKQWEECRIPLRRLTKGALSGALPAAVSNCSLLISCRTFC